MNKTLSNIERREPNNGHKQKIIEAIHTGNMDELFSALQELNNTLTGKQNEGHFSHGAVKQTKKELEEFINKIQQVKEGKAYSAKIVIYLGGATQRLLIKYDNGKILLEPIDFSSETAQKWEQLQ